MKPTAERLKALPWLDYEWVDFQGRGIVKRAKVRRPCGPCTACCTVVPVAEIAKGAHERCQYLELGKGCGIYDIRPASCFGWSCYWAIDDDLTEELRPDKSHIIIDMVYDVIETTNDDTGEKWETEVLALWGDPAFPDAHRAPAIRAVLLEVYQKTGMPTMFRRADDDVLLIVPPPEEGGEWIERDMVSETKLRDS